MKVFSFVMMLLGAAAAIHTSGCVVVKEYAPVKETAANVKPQELELARKLLRAFVKNDAKTFVALLPEETREKFTEKSFAVTRKSVIDSVGEPVSYSYVTTLKLPSLNPQIWKVCFRRHWRRCAGNQFPDTADGSAARWHHNRGGRNR